MTINEKRVHIFEKIWAYMSVWREKMKKKINILNSKIITISKVYS